MLALIIYGAPACGKSSLAQLYVNEGAVEINRDCIRFNTVSPGADWKTWNWDNESAVTKIWQQQLQDAIAKRATIVISDTNVTASKRKRLIKRLSQSKYTVLTVGMAVDRQVLIERDSKRGPASVGAEVIDRMCQNLELD